MEDQVLDISYEINKMLDAVTVMKEGISNYNSYLNIMEAAWDSIDALVFIKDDQNNLVYTNKYFCDIMNGEKSDFEGKNIEGLMKDNKTAAKYAANDLVVLKSGKPKVGIIERLMDSPYTVRTDKFPLRIEEKIIGILGISVIIDKDE